MLENWWNWNIDCWIIDSQPVLASFYSPLTPYLDAFHNIPLEPNTALLDSSVSCLSETINKMQMTKCKWNSR